MSYTNSNDNAVPVVVHPAQETTALAEEGGDVELGKNVDVERVEVSLAQLNELGYSTVEQLLRAELYQTQGANGGYNAGMHAKRSLNLGLTEEGRKEFKDARQRVLAQYGGRLLDLFDAVSKSN